MKQHLDSYNHFIAIDIKHIVRANELITCEADPNFYLKFLDVYLGQPSVEEEFSSERTWETDKFTPQAPISCILLLLHPVTAFAYFDSGVSAAGHDLLRADQGGRAVHAGRAHLVSSG